jgi:hypothetical protein
MISDEMLLKDSPRELVALLTGLTPAQRVTCPSCGAATIQAVSVEKKSLGAAMLTEWLLDSTAAGVAAGSKTVICNACLACGFQWLPGSPHEALARLRSDQVGDCREWWAEQESRHQALETGRSKNRITIGIVVGVAAAVAMGFWVYSANFSPGARDLQRTEKWATCVLELHKQDPSTCGTVSEARLRAWGQEGGVTAMRAWASPDWKKLEGLTTK